MGDQQMVQHAAIQTLSDELSRDRTMLGEALAALAHEVKLLSDRVVELAETIVAVE